MTNTLINRQWVEANPDKALEVINDLMIALRIITQQEDIGHKGCKNVAAFALARHDFTAAQPAVNTTNS